MIKLFQGTSTLQQIVIMTDYRKIQKEETLKAHIFADFFGKAKFRYEPNINNIDFVVAESKNNLIEYHYLWAEAKKGIQDIEAMLTQLILTFKKTYNRGEYLPPQFIGCFDTEKIAFVSFHDILPIFNESDFNWNQTPSNHETNDFKKAKSKVIQLVNKKISKFYFETDIKEIHEFIRKSFIPGCIVSKIAITKDNFVCIYNKWVAEIKPFINLSKTDWSDFKDNGILDCDFFRADMMSSGENTITEKLNVILKQDSYKLQEKIKRRLFTTDINFTDNGIAYKQFWNKYERPPASEYQQYIINRRDLFVPQNIRELKGSFFTPPIWVKKSQEYLKQVFGKNWQEEYYIWDCAAGTGNLLVDLNNKYNVWASTIDQSDVNTMYTLIDKGDLKLLENHVFQFDFLNDTFDKLPKELKNIIDDPEKRKKLIIYINPPYAEAADTEVITGRKNENKTGVAKNKMHEKFTFLKKANRELFVQFLTRIYLDINGCSVAEFSKLKTLQSPNFIEFRRLFLAKLKKCFIVPAYTFDNVTGKFPIGFKIWDTQKKEMFSEISADVYDEKNKLIHQKKYYSCDKVKRINDWLKLYADTQNAIAAMCCIGNDFQHTNYVNINFKDQLKGVGNAKGIAKFEITINNLIESSIYYAVRHCVKATWFNDRDQFLYPNDAWKKDKEFQTDCLIYTLFNNNIQSKYGLNHWIPFTEREVNAKEKFESHFMSDFLKDKKLSTAANNVFESGRKLWRYYHTKIKENKKESVNASFYDIREYFQGRNEKGAMKTTSNDEKYNTLITDLRNSLKLLATKIQPKIYKYEFL
jgi:hypothetical protein